METANSFPAYVDSLKQAVAELTANGFACDVPHLQRAKQARPKDVFKGTRVYFRAALFEWLEANPFETPLPDDSGEELEPKEILERRKLREQFLAARKKRLALDGEYISRADYKAKATQTIAQYRASTNRLKVDAPQWSGLPPHQILERVTRLIDESLREAHDSFMALARNG